MKKLELKLQPSQGGRERENYYYSTVLKNKKTEQNMPHFHTYYTICVTFINQKLSIQQEIQLQLIVIFELDKKYIKQFLSYFFAKKIPLSRRVESVLGLWMSQSVRDVCISHQSDWIYYKQPIKFLFVKVNGSCEDLIAIQFRTAIFILLQRGGNIHILG